MLNRYTIYAELVAKKDGEYTTYVFKNLDEPDNSWDRYIQAVRCPNWDCYEKMETGIKGYLTFEPVEAGSKYFNVHESDFNFYKYSGIYFINFVKEAVKQQDINYKF